jgi:hypothetical protein
MMLLAGLLFILGPSVWVEIHSSEPYQDKWRAIFHRYCEWKGWNQSTLSVPEYNEAAREADEIMDEIEMEEQTTKK